MRSQQAKNSHRLLNTRYLTILVIIGSMGLYSCKHSAQQNNPPAQAPVTLMQLLFGKGGGDHPFRNAMFGQDTKTVKASEKRVPDETDTNYLAYTLPVDTLHPDSVNGDIDSVTYFTIAYNFDKQKLNEIDEDIFLADDSIAANLAQRISDYFTEKYGEAATGSDSKVWSFKSNGKKIKVTLSDESAEYDYGKLSLVFYCEDY
jgi:hypothetical protein